MKVVSIHSLRPCLMMEKIPGGYGLLFLSHTRSFPSPFEQRSEDVFDSLVAGTESEGRVYLSQPTPLNHSSLSAIFSIHSNKHQKQGTFDSEIWPSLSHPSTLQAIWRMMRQPLHRGRQTDVASSNSMQAFPLIRFAYIQQ